MDVAAGRSHSVETPPIPVWRALSKLGKDIRDARRRRRIPTAIMADRASIVRTTLNKVKKVDPGVAVGIYASVLFVPGMIGRLGDLKRRIQCRSMGSACAGLGGKGGNRSSGLASGSSLVSNTDDHLRNRGFLFRGTDGWRLSPAYDLNPVPTEFKPRVPSTAIDLDDSSASIRAGPFVANPKAVRTGRGSTRRGSIAGRLPCPVSPCPGRRERARPRPGRVRRSGRRWRRACGRRTGPRRKARPPGDCPIDVFGLETIRNISGLRSLQVGHDHRGERVRRFLQLVPPVPTVQELHRRKPEAGPAPPKLVVEAARVPRRAVVDEDRDAGHLAAVAVEYAVVVDVI